VYNSSKFLDYISGRFGQSVRASLEAGEIVVTEIDKKTLPKFDAEEEMKAHVAGLKYWEQEECKTAKENHNKITMSIRQKLSTVHALLFSLCEVSLRSRLEVEADCQSMVKDRMHCSLKVCGLARKISNGSTNVVVEDVIGSMVESACSMMIIRGDEHESLPKHLEATEHRHQVAKNASLTWQQRDLEMLT